MTAQPQTAQASLSRSSQEAGTVFSPIEEILDELRDGRMVVICDDEDRENEGDLCLPAQFATPAAINFMLREASGYLFLSLTSDDCDRLDLRDQCAENTSAHGTRLTVTIDGHPKHGFTTGVSASERAKTIQLAIDGSSSPDDFVRPGHINPLRALEGGVLVRSGHTEALVDLCRLAGLRPAAVGIEICKLDGEMARVPDLIEFCAKHGLKMCTIEDVISYRLRTDSLVHRRGAPSGIPIETEHGTFQLITYDCVFHPEPHYALVMGDVAQSQDAGADESVLVRVHRTNIFEDVFKRLRPGAQPRSGSQIIDASMRRIAEAGRGAIVFLRPNDRGAEEAALVGASDAPSATTAHQQEDLSKAALEQRQIGIGCQILRDLGIHQLKLMTTRQQTIPALSGFGLHVTEFVTDL